MNEAKLAANDILKSYLSYKLNYNFIDDPVTLGLGTPTALDAYDISNESFTANWLGVAGATGYILEIFLDEALTISLSGYAGRLTGNVTSFVVNEAIVETETGPFYYRVQAFNDSIVSEFSNVIPVDKIILDSTNFNLPTGKSASLLYNRESMIGSGTSINDLANSNDATLSNSTSWVSDTKWGYGINLALVNSSIAHNNNYKSSGSNAKFIHAYALKINEITTNTLQALYTTQNVTPAAATEINVYYRFDGLGRMILGINLHDASQGSDPSILGLESQPFYISVNQEIGIAYLIDLSTSEIKIIFNQNELTYSINTAGSYFYSSIINFKNNGGQTNYSDTVYLQGNDNYLPPRTKAILFRLLIANESNTPTTSEVKAMFMQMGLT